MKKKIKGRKMTNQQKRNKRKVVGVTAAATMKIVMIMIRCRLLLTR